MLRIPFSDLQDTLSRVLLKTGFSDARAALCARLFAETSRDGIYSHGLNRFPLFISMVKSGIVNILAEPTRMSSTGVIERWNGNAGPGNLNAYQCMDRAIALATKHGLGCLALANTNHWMRGGTYGWQAADAGFIAICWTNTSPNLPPWGASEARLGNNPLVIAVPRRDGPIVLDMAISQFSYGALASYRVRHELLPVEGGFDKQGKLTRLPAAIEASRRPLPIGYWKGSGLALMLDLLAAILSTGNASYQISSAPELETRLSQVFMAFRCDASADRIPSLEIANKIIAHLQLPLRNQGESIRYPGERVMQNRRENLELGVPVEPSIWSEIRAMLER